MSADRRHSAPARCSPVGLLFAAMLFLGVARPAAAAPSWERFINVFEFPRTAYQDAEVLDILKDIENHVREQAEDVELPPLKIVLQSDPDLSRRLSFTVPELSAGFAMSFVIRQAGLGSEIIRNDLFIFPAPSRDAGLRAMEIELTARGILVLNLDREPAEVEPDVFELARDVLLSTRIFRLGPDAADRVPVEFAALELILRSPTPAVFLEDVLASDHPAGRLYAMAGLHAIGAELPEKPNDPGVPVIRPGARLITLADAADLFENQVRTGALIQSVKAHTKSDP